MQRISSKLRPAAALFGMCVFVGVCLAANKPQPAPLAHFCFNGDANDENKENPAFNLKNTEFRDNALYLNGNYEFRPTKVGYHAVCTTSKLDYKKFTVALRFKPEEFGEEKSNLLTGGTACRWFGMNRSRAGNLTITLNNQSFTHEIKGAALEKGKWTTVACGVDISDRKVIVYHNGKKVANIELPKNFKLGVLGSDFEDSDKQWSFSNYSNGDAFHGLVDELIILGRILSPTDFEQILSRPQIERADHADIRD